MRSLLPLALLGTSVWWGTACAPAPGPRTHTRTRTPVAEERLVLGGSTAAEEPLEEEPRPPPRGFAAGSTNGRSSLAPTVNGEHADEVPQTLDGALEQRFSPPPNRPPRR